MYLPLTADECRRTAAVLMTAAATLETPEGGKNGALSV
jgi:hypothetical protein